MNAEELQIDKILTDIISAIAGDSKLLHPDGTEKSGASLSAIMERALKEIEGTSITGQRLLDTLSWLEREGVVHVVRHVPQGISEYWAVDLLETAREQGVEDIVKARLPTIN